MMSFFVQARRIVICELAGALFIPAAQAGIIEGVNHTHWAINKFSVDGRSALDIIGPWQGGGGGYFSMPARWSPRMTVKVQWETGIAYPDGFPGFQNSEAYDAWLAKIRAQNRQLSKVVPVPDYTGEDVCGITIHFLPCDELQVTTSCHRYGSDEYPIKIPLELPEPQSCPVVERVRAEGAS
ncbi:DUF3304 domain-containing protein [Pseudomonas huaxiensis]|uniref:DUF3304 domain-containing protein n=1 Tax=Pseudomonas huaxiensis TaxID=2213017 RepID=UPI001CDCA0C9|nr:DUF3304 domain-containing protein [Pseudomonas huaxiensis]